MRPFYNTPTCSSSPYKPVKPDPTPLELLLKLEDEYADYRFRCNNGYCRSSDEIHANYRSEIAAAIAKAKADS